MEPTFHPSSPSTARTVELRLLKTATSPSPQYMGFRAEKSVVASTPRVGDPPTKLYIPLSCFPAAETPPKVKARKVRSLSSCWVPWAAVADPLKTVNAPSRATRRSETNGSAHSTAATAQQPSGSTASSSVPAM
jgi:hypothetical protein